MSATARSGEREHPPRSFGLIVRAESETEVSQCKPSAPVPLFNHVLEGVPPRYQRTITNYLLVLIACSTLQAGSHVRSTRTIDGFFYPDASKEGVYYFQSESRIERFDISGEAFLTASGVYPPEIPGLSGLRILVTKDGKVDIREKDADAIRALAAKQGPNISNLSNRRCGPILRARLRQDTRAKDYHRKRAR